MEAVLEHASARGLYAAAACALRSGGPAAVPHHCMSAAAPRLLSSTGSVVAPASVAPVAAAAAAAGSARAAVAAPEQSVPSPPGGSSGGGGGEGGGEATHAALLALLRAARVEFVLSTHAPTRTSEESAAVRGATLASGAKAMFVRASADAYALAVLSAARKLDWKALRGVLGYKKAALADEGEVARVTGCVPGAVPPFGCLWPGVRTLVDESLMAQGDSINFNAGLRTASLRMSVDDYLRVSGGERAAFTADT